MKKVYKYKIEFNTDNMIPIRSGTRPLHFDAKEGELYVWCEYEEGNNEHNSFRIFGTGWDIPHNYVHCSSVVVDGFVWHLYECR